MRNARKDVSRRISLLLLTVLILLFALSICRQWLPAMDIGLTVLLYTVLYFIPIFFYLRANRYKARAALRLKAVKPRYWIFILLFGLSVCLICTLINVGTVALFRSLFHIDFAETGTVNLTGDHTGALLLTGAVLPAIAEEVLLRGLVQGEYEKYGVTIGVLLTAVIFALFHTNPAHLPALFIAGVCYGVLTVLFKSVWPAVIAHTLNNAIAVLIAQKQDLLRYLLQDKLFVIIAVLACFLILIFTLKMMETVSGEELGRKTFKKSTRSLAYGDPMTSPWLWISIALCVGKMIYNGFYV